MKVAITGGSLNGNSGAEAMLVTAIQRIKEKYPKAEFGIYTPYFKDDMAVWQPKKNIHLIDSSPLKLAFLIFPFSVLGGLFKLLRLNFLKKLFPKSVQFLWESSILLDVAGVSFIDSRIKFLPFNVLTIYPAFLFRVPVVKLAQAVGPFNKKINNFLAKHCFKKMEHLFARGEKTMEFLLELGLDQSKYSLSTDVVFCNKLGDSLTVENEDKLREGIEILSKYKVEGNQLVGVCPSSVIATGDNGDKYKQVLKDIISHLLSINKVVVLFPNATKEHKPEVWRNNDIPLIKELAGEIESENLIVFDYNLNADGVKKLIDEVDWIVVSRFHAMIFALLLKTPPLVIGWSHKYLEIMKQFGLEEYVENYQNLEIEIIKEKIQSVTNNFDKIRDRIFDNIIKLQTLSSNQINYVSYKLSKKQ